MSHHTTRHASAKRMYVEPRRFPMDSDYGPYTGHPDDPRNDGRTADEIWEDEQAFARLRKADQQRKQQQEQACKAS